jgi:hypothetical protein
VNARPDLRSSRFIGPENPYGSHSFVTADQNRKFEAKGLMHSIFKRVVCRTLCILFYKAVAFSTFRCLHGVSAGRCMQCSCCGLLECVGKHSASVGGGGCNRDMTPCHGSGG